MVYKHCFKVFIDKIISFIGILLLIPWMILLIGYMYLISRENPFFCQQRAGQYGRLFTLIKLKTMKDRWDENGKLLPDHQRITRLGRFLRNTSIDELPQLLNVLKGDMSLVGPRPLLKEYLPVYSEFQRRRHEVLPGITGWAQVNGRNAISWQEKFELDIWYVDHISFQLDMKILFLTVKNSWKSENINHANEITMPWFDGSN